MLASISSPKALYNDILRWSKQHIWCSNLKTKLCTEVISKSDNFTLSVMATYNLLMSLKWTYVNCLILFVCKGSIPHWSPFEIHNYLYNHFYVLVTWLVVTTTNKVMISKGILMLCMAYNSEAFKGIAIKHTELLHGPSVYNRSKYWRLKFETFLVDGIFSLLYNVCNFIMSVTFFADRLRMGQIWKLDCHFWFQTVRPHIPLIKFPLRGKGNFDICSTHRNFYFVSNYDCFHNYS